MSEKSNFRHRALNVLAVLLNLATVYCVLIAVGGIVHVVLNRGGWEHAIIQFLISAAGLAIVLAVSYLVLGNVGVWNRLKRSNNAHAA
jgi:uncharacterized membrane protein